MAAPQDERKGTNVYDESARRREPACLVVLDSDCNIVSAEPRFAAFMADAGLTRDDPCRLPAMLEGTLKAHIDGSVHPTGDIVFVAANLMLRAVELSGPGGSCLALSVERMRERDPIAGAARRYRLTPREIDVLCRILDGKSALTIANELAIARSTVHEHFKHLVEKVGAANRSDLIARILNWTPKDP